MPRTQLTIEEKFAIICQFETGQKATNLSKEFNVCRTAIYKIVKSKEKVIEQFEKCEKKKRIRSHQHPELDKALLAWFTQQRANKVPISGSLLQEKANELAILLKMENFQCSSSWIQRFRSRHNITFGKISGESATVDRALTGNWISNVWPMIRDGYNEDQIYNADEMGLFFRMPPDHTFKFKGENCAGGKLSKERITVLVTSNMTGTDKKRLLIIGKSKSPRCFKNIHRLPVDYDFNKKAWMTSLIFEQFLRKWDADLGKQKRRILLTVDNCPAHPHVDKLKNIQLVFLPPNTTSVLQPMDQGVIHCLKVAFRKELVYKIIQKLDSGNHTQVNVLEAIMMISKAWEKVPKSTIVNFFIHAGFSSATTTTPPEENEVFEDLQRAVASFNTPCAVEEFLSVDDNLVVCETLSDEEIVNNVQSHQEDINDHDNDNQDFGDPPTAAEAYAACQVLRSYQVINQKPLDKKFDEISSDIERQYFLNVFENKKQTLITNYFN